MEGIIRTLDHVAEPNPEWSGLNPRSGNGQVPYRIYNIGSNNPVELSRYIEILEECLGMKAKRNLLPMQPGDVPATYADVQALIDDVGYRPQTTVEEGNIKRFVAWYRDFTSVKDKASVSEDIKRLLENNQNGRRQSERKIRIFPTLESSRRRPICGSDVRIAGCRQTKIVGVMPGEVLSIVTWQCRGSH